MAIKLMIFEDNEVLRNSVCSLLGRTEDFKVVASHPDVLNILAQLKEGNPEVVILDIDMPKKDGISAIPIIKEYNPDISVVMYTQFEDEAKLFKSLCAGANGYILKKTAPLKLIDAIHEVRDGGAPMSPAIARKVMASFYENSKPQKQHYDLTPRELEVLKLLIKGCSVKFIAAELGIAYETSRSHLRNIYRKLHVNCGKEAIAKVLAERIEL